MTWEINITKNKFFDHSSKEMNITKKLAVKYNNPVLIIGLPGIASVGKIAIDYLSEELKSEKIAEFISDKGPGFTIISDKNLVIIPKIELKHINQNKRDFFFLTGDYQPVNNSELQSLCRTLLDFTKKLGIKQIITLGGIGLEEEPDKPKVYAAGNNEKFIESLKTYRIKQDTFMHVGTIMGITGLMVALAEVNAAALLIETSAYPGYIGLDASKQLLKLLKKMFDFNIKFNNLNKELKLIQKLRDEAFLSQKESHKKGEEPNYIG